MISPRWTWLIVLTLAGVSALLLADRAEAQSAYFPLTPCRAVDTRAGTPDPLQNGVARNFAIAGSCGIPVAATAVAFNFTVTQATGAGFLTVFPQGTTQPAASLLQFGPGQSTIVSNAATLALGSGNGGVTANATIPSGGTVHLIINVYGYYQPFSITISTMTPGGRASWPSPSSSSRRSRISGG